MNDKLTMNGVECDDCSGFGNYYETGEQDYPECPEDPDHVAVIAVHISHVPLGRPDDDINRVGLRQLWAYPEETP